MGGGVVGWWGGGKGEGSMASFIPPFPCHGNWARARRDRAGRDIGICIAEEGTEAYQGSTWDMNFLVGA